MTTTRQRITQAVRQTKWFMTLDDISDSHNGKQRNLAVQAEKLLARHPGKKKKHPPKRKADKRSAEDIRLLIAANLRKATLRIRAQAQVQARDTGPQLVKGYSTGRTKGDSLV